MIKYALIILACFSLFLSCKENTDASPVINNTSISKDTIVDNSAEEQQQDKVSDSVTETGCAILRKGVFKYKDTDGEDVTVKIVEDVITEEHKGGKYILMSKVTWKGDCEYDNMLIMSTVPKVTIEPGTVMNVVIDKVEGKKIYFTATAKGKSYHSILTKIR